MTHESPKKKYPFILELILKLVYFRPHEVISLSFLKLHVFGVLLCITA